MALGIPDHFPGRVPRQPDDHALSQPPGDGYRGDDPGAAPRRHRAAGELRRGNLCPDGAVIKQAAASPALLMHRGRAVVFHSQDDLEARIDDPDLDVRPDDLLVLQMAAPSAALCPSSKMAMRSNSTCR